MRLADVGRHLAAERPDTLALTATSRVRSRRLIWLGPVDSRTWATWFNRTMRRAAVGIAPRAKGRFTRSCGGARLRTQAHVDVVGLVVGSAPVAHRLCQPPGSQRRPICRPTGPGRGGVAFDGQRHRGFVGLDAGIQVTRPGMARIFSLRLAVRRSSSEVSGPCSENSICFCPPTAQQNPHG